MLERLKSNWVAVTLGGVIAAMVVVGKVREFVETDGPWALAALAPLLRALTEPWLLAGLSTGLLAMFLFRYMQAVTAISRITRDYYAEKSALEHKLDPERYGPVSATVGHGFADSAFVREVYRRYGIERLAPDVESKSKTANG